MNAPERGRIGKLGLPPKQTSRGIKFQQRLWAQSDRADPYPRCFWRANPAQMDTSGPYQRCLKAGSCSTSDSDITSTSARCCGRSENCSTDRIALTSHRSTAVNFRFIFSIIKYLFEIPLFFMGTSSRVAQNINVLRILDLLFLLIFRFFQISYI